MIELNKFIEHTVLKPETTQSDVRKVCEEAIKYQFAGICVPPLYMRDSRRILGDGSKIKLATAIGFPMGYSAIAAKIEEIKRAIDEGADEIDAVINISAVKSGAWTHVEHDIDSLARATHMRGRTLKLVLECGFLSEEDIIKLCQLAKREKVEYLSTGTGFLGHPATTAMIQMLKKHADPSIKIKAAGGIRTSSTAKELIDAGADRLASSSAIDLVKK